MPIELLCLYENDDSTVEKITVRLLSCVVNTCTARESWSPKNCHVWFLNNTSEWVPEAWLIYPDQSPFSAAEHCRLPPKRELVQRIIAEPPEALAATKRAEKKRRTQKPRAPRRYTGVFRQGRAHRAQISFNGKVEYLGIFDSGKAAAHAFDRRAKEIGRIASLNFPNEAVHDAMLTDDDDDGKARPPPPEDRDDPPPPPSEDEGNDPPSSPPPPEDHRDEPPPPTAPRSVAQLTAYSELTDRNHVLNLWNFLEQKLAEGYTYFYGAKSTFAENGAGVSELTRKYESRVIIQHLLDYYARYRPHGMVTSIYVNRNDQPINVNRTTACTVHRDEKNAGHSSTMTLGDFDGGALEVFPSPFHNALPPKNRSLLPGAWCTR